MSTANQAMIELGRMTTFEAGERFKQVEAAIIPVGSTEQHGYNMTLDTDTRLAHGVANKIAERMYPRLLVLPPIPVGVSYHHMDFAGSMTLSPATLQAVVFDYIKSMKRHGIKRFLLMNGHGGNQTTLSVASTVARHELGVQIANIFYWNLASEEISSKVKSVRYGHACEAEASFGLYLDPGIVRADDLHAAEMLDYPLVFSQFEPGPRVDYPYSWKQLTKDGSFGDARDASLQLGQEIIDLVILRMERFIEDFLKLDPVEAESL
ncbi:creatininase family protein [Brevibacillus sp. B_LB10_24]|uniref:creatininase family protein n=1 Tax=Brevibacillus sp. B_LB10_24 TaxID=3380645 RepID=UPI0038BA34C7